MTATAPAKKPVRTATKAGVILRFERVRPRRSERFQPHQSREITPEFLDRTIRALKRWHYDIVGIEEACRRAATMPERRRFACLTFDGGYKDQVTNAYPVLARHGVPFTVYLPTGVPDGICEAWWLALEDIIARKTHLSLAIDSRERHFTIDDTDEKYDAYEFLSGWMRTLAPPALSFAIHDLCSRYAVDLAALSRSVAMDWDDVARLAADPNVTIGSATLSYPVLSNLKDSEAEREMAMGKSVAETVLDRNVRHFAFPFGDRDAWRRQHVLMAESAGFASAVSAIPGIVEAEGRTNLYALPRISWDGRQRSLRMMRVLLSGCMYAPVRPTPRSYGS